MDKFWDALDRSVIVSGFIGVAMVTTACYCVVTQTPLPEYFALAFGMVVGFFFSQKVTAVQARRVS